jgi:hypothetical protein
MAQSEYVTIATSPVMFRAGQEITVRVTINSNTPVTDSRLDLIAVADGQPTVYYGKQGTPLLIDPPLEANTTYTFDIPVMIPAAPASKLSLAVFLLGKDEDFVGGPPNAPNVAEKKFVMRCQMAGDGTSRTATFVTCAYTPPSIIAGATIKRERIEPPR